MSGRADSRTALRAALERVLRVDVTELTAVSGGDLSDAYRATLAGDRQVFVKTSPAAQPGGFTAEAAGLSWISSAPGAPQTPDVIAVHDPPDPVEPPDPADPPDPVDPPDPAGPPQPATRFLVLEWIHRGSSTVETDEQLGRSLAALHRAGAAAHGATPPGAPEGLRIGPLQFSPRATGNWVEFYAECLVLPLAHRAASAGTLPRTGISTIERLTDRLGDLAGPAESPARLHGDLWAGNVLADRHATPYLIDPACYGGHREVDLAMLRLFGGPGPACFAAYDEAFPLATGHADRVQLWQLFPLLVHAVLFGGGYGDRAVAIARHYVG